MSFGEGLGSRLGRVSWVATVLREDSSNPRQQRSHEKAFASSALFFAGSLLSYLVCVMPVAQRTPSTVAGIVSLFTYSGMRGCRRHSHGFVNIADAKPRPRTHGSNRGGAKTSTEPSSTTVWRFGASIPSLAQLSQCGLTKIEAPPVHLLALSEVHKMAARHWYSR